MVSTVALTIAIPLLFLILMQLIRVTRATSVLTDLDDREYHPPREKPTIDYDPFPRHRLAHRMADLLPTLGRWGSGMGVFALLNLLTTSYILVVSVGLGYIGATENRVAFIGAGGLVLVWFVLPFLSVEEYDRFAQIDRRPKSLDFHVTAVFFELLLILGTLILAEFTLQNLPTELTVFDHTLMSDLPSQVSTAVLFGGGYVVLHYHNLFYNPTFVIMLSQEVKALDELERDVGPND